MSRRHILFVGDLRTAYNYGAIATTESLLDLIRKAAPNDEIQLIDHRSFSGTTPPEGWPVVDYKSVLQENKKFKNTLIKVIKRIGIYAFLIMLKGRLAGKQVLKDNVPNRYDKYSNFAKKVVEGNEWKFEKSKIEWADLVIINSEGNIVNGTDSGGLYRVGGRYVLFFSFLAKIILKKPCYIINHTVDPKNRNVEEIIKNIYPVMDGIYVREKKSYDLLNSWGISNMQYVPDALWSHDFEKDIEVNPPVILKNFDFSKPYICIGDSSGICNKYSHVKWDVDKVYSKMIFELKKICDQIIFIDGYSGENKEINNVIKHNGLLSVNLKNCNYHELYYILSHAQLFVSGRWHASIIALLGHTPILLWGSDSHKTEALYGEVDYNYEFFDVTALPLNIDRIVKEAKRIISDDHSDLWINVEKLKKASFDNIKMLV